MKGRDTPRSSPARLLRVAFKSPTLKGPRRARFSHRSSRAYLSVVSATKAQRDTTNLSVDRGNFSGTPQRRARFPRWRRIGRYIRGGLVVSSIELSTAVSFRGGDFLDFLSARAVVPFSRLFHGPVRARKRTNADSRLGIGRWRRKRRCRRKRRSGAFECSSRTAS